MESRIRSAPTGRITPVPGFAPTARVHRRASGLRPPLFAGRVGLVYL